MKKITMTSGKEYFAVTEPFQSSTFAGAPQPELLPNGEPNPVAGEPTFTLELVIFLDVEGMQRSCVVDHIESITEIPVVAEAPEETPAPETNKLTLPGNVPVARTD